MRRDDDITVALALSPLEVVFVDLMAGSENVSRCNIIRSALWSLADHMGYDPPLGVFDMRESTGRPAKNGKRRRVRRRIGPRIQQEHGAAQTAEHPWSKEKHAARSAYAANKRIADKQNQ